MIVTKKWDNRGTGYTGLESTTRLSGAAGQPDRGAENDAVDPSRGVAALLAPGRYGSHWHPDRTGRCTPPTSVGCDQEVNNRTLVTPHKICEEVSLKETRNHFEPCDVQVSLPRRADE
jgi:hypothetical protein